MCNTATNRARHESVSETEGARTRQSVALGLKLEA